MSEQLDLGSAMKAGMRHLAGGVAVVAARGADGAPAAMTVTSVTSVSDAPASLLVCLNRSSGAYRAVEGSELFSVNILSQAQQQISERCSRTPEDGDRFSVGEWRNYQEAEVPYLADSLASFLCRVTRKIDYGTHCIVVGDIEAVVQSGSEEQPLVYFRGAYTTTV